jgi:hypothetical protein
MRYGERSSIVMVMILKYRTNSVNREGERPRVPVHGAKYGLVGTGPD